MVEYCKCTFARVVDAARDKNHNSFSTRNCENNTHHCFTNCCLLHRINAITKVCGSNPTKPFQHSLKAPTGQHLFMQMIILSCTYISINNGCLKIKIITDTKRQQLRNMMCGKTKYLKSLELNMQKNLNMALVPCLYNRQTRTHLASFKV